MKTLPKAKDVLFYRMVSQYDGLHDEDGFKERMSEGYGDQIHEAMIVYAKQVLDCVLDENNINKTLETQYHQLCPKCIGEGKVPNIGGTTISALLRICPVCDGNKIITLPFTATTELSQIIKIHQAIQINQSILKIKDQLE